MPDNVGITPGNGATAASDDINNVQYQRVKITHGRDGVNDGDTANTNPLPVAIAANLFSAPANLGAIGDTEQAGEQLESVIVNDGYDEPLQLVGLHPNFPLPIDTSSPIPVAGKTLTGAQAQLQVNEQGGLVLADGVTLTGQRSSIGTILVIDTIGYASIAVQITGTWSGTISFQTANDLSSPQVASGWPTASAQTMTSTATTNGMLVFPTSGRFFRIAFTSFTSGVANVTAVLRAQQAYTFSSTPGVSLNQIAASSINATTAQLGVNAFGWDGTTARRLLTDSSGDTLIAGASAAASTTVTNPVQVGLGDLEGRVRRLQGDFSGRLRIVNEESGRKDDGVIDALNNVVRELKLLNARIADLPYFLGVNAVMPSDELSFRDDPTIFSI